MDRAVCPACLGQRVGEVRVPLAEALRSDPETRAALRAIFAEAFGELREAGIGYEHQFAAMARVLEREG